jgi:23S rRNA (cytidine1920-2'-O)/16S rRNA (cytidine1409-2'-O)-methyltransferase
LHALREWAPDGLSAAGRRCLDVGASTGGFTQVLLAEGATHVTALDVGHGQLVADLADDPRVRDLPGTNIRHVVPADLGEPFELVVADLSFISLEAALPAMTSLVSTGGDLVLLVKPQFEVGRERLGRGGVVHSPRERARALHRVVDAAVAGGLVVRGLTRSPLTGAHGNTEYLLWLSPAAPGMMSIPDTTARIDQLTGEERR